MPQMDYQNYVRGMFDSSKQALSQQVSEEKAAAKSQATQANLSSGTKGPVATALSSQAVRKVGEAGTKQLLNLDAEGRQAQYQAFQLDKKEQADRDKAFQDMIGNIVGGVATVSGTLLGGPLGGALAGTAVSGFNAPTGDPLIDFLPNGKAAF